MKSRWAHFAIAAFSVVFALVLAELVLRIAVPRYQYAAESLYERDRFRLYTRTPNSMYWRVHPDTGERHRVFHNNLALRQHRDIDPVKGAGEIRIGLFGDSFTENLRLPSAYSFSEVLYHLLSSYDTPIDVLNFGVDGYATDQSYLTYRDSEHARNLDLVYYVFAPNDTRGNYINALFELTPDGQLKQTQARALSPWVYVASKFYLSYLVIDAKRRFLPDDDEPEAVGFGRDLPRAQQMRADRKIRFDDSVDRAVRDFNNRGMLTEPARAQLDLFRRILSKWRTDVERRGGRFAVVMVPKPFSSEAAQFALSDFDVIDLDREIAREGFDGMPWIFETDPHWNELGNQFAAIRIARHVGATLGLPPLPDAEIHSELYAYYRAFNGWVPTTWVEETGLDPARLLAIRQRILPLEMSAQEKGSISRAP